MIKLGPKIRWLVPLALVALVAAYFVLGPMIGVHAAGIHSVTPDGSWSGH